MLLLKDAGRARESLSEEWRSSRGETVENQAERLGLDVHGLGQSPAVEAKPIIEYVDIDHVVIRYRCMMKFPHALIAKQVVKALAVQRAGHPLRISACPQSEGDIWFDIEVLCRTESAAAVIRVLKTPPRPAVRMEVESKTEMLSAFL